MSEGTRRPDSDPADLDSRSRSLTAKAFRLTVECTDSRLRDSVGLAPTSPLLEQYGVVLGGRPYGRIAGGPTLAEVRPEALPSFLRSRLPQVQLPQDQGA